MVHHVHEQAYQRVSLLYLIVHGENFDAKAMGVGTVVSRYIESEENRRRREGQTMQDDTWMEEAGATGLVLESPSKWHQDLINAWDSNTPAKMTEAIAQNLDTLQNEQMIGMAQLMLESLIQKKIRDLSATYLTLSFAEIAQKTGLVADTLEQFITKMVQRRAITARINKKQGTVDFIEGDGDAEDDSSSTLVNRANFEMIKTVEAQNARIVKLLSRVQDTNEKIKQSDDYTTAKARKSLQGSAGGDEGEAQEDYD